MKKLAATLAVAVAVAMPVSAEAHIEQKCWPKVVAFRDGLAQYSDRLQAVRDISKRIERDMRSAAGTRNEVVARRAAARLISADLPVFLALLGRMVTQSSTSFEVAVGMLECVQGR